jgi:hypothetical protein
MSENATWEITLARSIDLQPINPLPYSFSFNPIFNRPGSFSMTLPLDDDVAYNVAKHSTCIIAERNGQPQWSGSIVSVNRNPAAMTLDLSALGWLDELNHRFVRPTEEAGLFFNNVAGGAIVQGLLSTVNAQTTTDSTPAPTHLIFGSHSDTQVRTRSYKRGQNYGQAVQELVDIENGLDIAVNPTTREIVTKPPTSYVDHQEVLFGWGIEPNNLANAPQSDDGTSTAERVTAVGSNGIIVPADDANAIAAHGGAMREEWISLSDVSNSGIVGAYANSELVYRLNGQISYELVPLAYGDIPRLYDDFNLGDKVYLSVSAGALQVDKQAVRVFSATVTVDAQGNEVLSAIGTSPQ